MYFYYRDLRVILSIGSVGMSDNLVKEVACLEDEKNMLKFLRQYLIEKKFKDAQVCLEFALDVHKAQKRIGGKPYIVHPLAVVIHGILNGVGQETYLNEEYFIGAGIAHDTIEDHPNRNQEFNNLPIHSEIKQCVHILDKSPYRKKYPNNKKQADDEYYQGICQNALSSRIKLEDRYDNFRTMGNAFSLERKIKYLDEFYQRYPTLMKSYEDALSLQIFKNQPYFVLKNDLYQLADSHEKTVLEDIAKLNEDEKRVLTKDLNSSRMKKIA